MEKADICVYVRVWVCSSWLLFGMHKHGYLHTHIHALLLTEWYVSDWIRAT